MRQYTTPEQTAKLIELGFEKPKGWYADGVTNNINLYVNIDRNPMMFNYSIGELIEMLPKRITNSKATFLLNIKAIHGGWRVNYQGLRSLSIRKCESSELVDALYQMTVKLKEEGVI